MTRPSKRELERAIDRLTTTDGDDDTAIRVVYHTNGHDTLETEDGEPVDPDGFTEEDTVIALHRDYVDVDGVDT